MDAWAVFWGIVLAAVLSVFAVLAVVVTIGGFFDLKTLLAAGDRADDQDDSGCFPAGQQRASSESEASDV